MQQHFSAHEVVSIASLRTSINKSGTANVAIQAQELKCHKHKDEPLKLYCYTCHKLVCRDCTLVDHKEHKYVFVIDAALNCKTTIRKKAEMLQNVLPSMKMALQSLTESEKSLSAHNSAIMKAIDNAHDKIGSKLQQKRKELNEAATQKIDECQKKIETGKMKAELAIAEVTSLHELLDRNLERATDQELFSFMKQMSDEADRAALLYANAPEIFPVPALPQLEVHCNDDVLQVLQEEMFIDDSGRLWMTVVGVCAFCVCGIYRCGLSVHPYLLMEKLYIHHLMTCVLYHMLQVCRII